MKWFIKCSQSFLWFSAELFPDSWNVRWLNFIVFPEFMTSVLTWQRNVSFLCKLFGLSENVFSSNVFYRVCNGNNFCFIRPEVPGWRKSHNKLSGRLGEVWLGLTDNLYLYSGSKKIYLGNISTIRSPILCPFTSVINHGWPKAGYKTAWSTLIGRAPTLLRSHWSRASLSSDAGASSLMPKRTSSDIQSPLLGSLERKIFCLLLAGSLWHKDSWLPCMERSY